MKNTSKSLLVPAFLISLMLATAACSTVQSSGNMVRDTNEKLAVAVLPFQITGAKWGGEFSDAIAMNLQESDHFRIIERTRLASVIKEQSFSQSGLISDADRKRIGQMFGVTYLIMGRGSANRYRDREKKLHDKLVDTFTMNLVDVETGEIVLTVRKSEGRVWTPLYIAKFLLSLSLIWDREDILIESTNYDNLSKSLVQDLLKRIQWPAPVPGQPVAPERPAPAP